MKQNSTSSLSLGAAFAAVIFTTAVSSEAATITIDSVTPTVTGAITPDFVANPYAVAEVRPTFSKLSGTGSYTATGAVSQVVLTVVGSLADVSTVDEIGLDYDFTFDLTGSGSVSWDITTLLFGSIAGPSDSGGPVTSADSGVFSGSESAFSPVPLSSATFTATITANWTGATNGDTLTLEIPNNSIDFRTEPIPEPSSSLLFSLSGLLLFRRKRS